jgi:hypothetical protein
MFNLTDDYIDTIDELHKRKYDNGFFLDLANTAVPVYLYMEKRYAPLLQGWHCMLKCFIYLYELEDNELRGPFLKSLMKFASGYMDGASSLIASSIKEGIDGNIYKPLLIQLSDDYNGLIYSIQALKLRNFEYRVNAVYGEINEGAKIVLEPQEKFKNSLTPYISGLSELKEAVTEPDLIKVLNRYISFLENDIEKVIYEYERLDSLITLLERNLGDYRRGNKILNRIESVETAARLKYQKQINL